MESHISDEQWGVILDAAKQSVANGDIEVFVQSIRSVYGNDYIFRIDSKYISDVNDKKRATRVEDINRMLKKMTLEQLDNVYTYTYNEYHEPNHEFDALDAVIKLSKSKNSEGE